MNDIYTTRNRDIPGKKYLSTKPILTKVAEYGITSIKKIDDKSATRMDKLNFEQKVTEVLNAFFIMLFVLMTVFFIQSSFLNKKTIKAITMAMKTTIPMKYKRFATLN